MISRCMTSRTPPAGGIHDPAAVGLFQGTVFRHDEHPHPAQVARRAASFRNGPQTFGEGGRFHEGPFSRFRRSRLGEPDSSLRFAPSDASFDERDRCASLRRFIPCGDLGRAAAASSAGRPWPTVRRLLPGRWSLPRNWGSRWQGLAHACWIGATTVQAHSTWSARMKRVASPPLITSKSNRLVGLGRCSTKGIPGSGTACPPGRAEKPGAWLLGLELRVTHALLRLDSDHQPIGLPTFPKPAAGKRLVGDGSEEDRDL